MSYGAYLTGLAFLAGTLLAVLAAAILIVSAHFSHLRGAARLLAIALLGSTGLIWVHLVPGALGILGRPTVAIAAMILLAACWLAARRAEPTGTSDITPAPALRPHGDALSIAAASLAVAAVLLVALAYLRQTATVPIDGIDALSFHLPGVARWIETGSIWGVNQFIPSQAQAYYPNNGDVLTLSLMLPFHDAALVRLLAAPLLALLGLAVYALAGELGAIRSVATSFAALFVSIPVVLEPALKETLPDAFMLACFAAGILFGLRYLREERRSELVLCGLGLGLAVGTKWYGVSSVAALTAAAAAALLIGGRSRRLVARELLLLIGMMGLAGGFWFLRNAIASGNPVFPVKLAPLGVTIFDAPRDTIRELSGFTILDYAGDWEVWRTYLLPALWRSLRIPGLVVAVGLAASLGVSFHRLRASRRAKRAGTSVATDEWAAHTAFLGLVAILLVGVYAITPYSAFGPEGMPVQADANTRYLLPAVLLATVLGAATVSRFPRVAPAAQAVVLVAIADALLNGLRSGRFSFVQAGMALLVGGTGAALLVRQARRGPARRLRWLAPAAAAAAAILIVVGGRRIQQRIDADPYRGKDAALDRVLAADGVDIALAGEWDETRPSPPFPAFGARLENDVVYAGPFIDDMLRRYRARRPFLRRLSEEQIDLLLIGRSLAPRGVPREARWAGQAGWRKVDTSPRFLLFAP